MKRFVRALLSAFALCMVLTLRVMPLPADINGSWTATGVSVSPWTFAFTDTQGQLSGNIRAGSGATLQGPQTIFDTSLNGNAISFKATSPDGDRTITFRGTINGNEIALTRTVQVRSGGSRGGTDVFGASAIVNFSIRRSGATQGTPRVTATAFGTTTTLGLLSNATVTFDPGTTFTITVTRTGGTSPWTYELAAPNGSGQDELITTTSTSYTSGPKTAEGKWWTRVDGGTWSSFTLTPSARADLVFTGAEPSFSPSSVAPGGSLQVGAWTVKNQGTTASGAFTDGVYLSRDAVIDPLDTLLASVPNANLAAGQSLAFDATSVTIPAETAAGHYYVGILLDRSNAISETTKTDNYAAAPLVIGASTSTTFAITGLASNSRKSSGGSSSVSVGYARIQRTAGAGSTSGVAIFSYRSGGILLSEAGVPASPLLSSARIYAETSSTVRTGVAIASPNGRATLSYSFIDVNGSTAKTGTLDVGGTGGGQTAAFLDESPFSGPATFQGTFSFTSTLPVAVTALRGLTNERGDFLMTTLPVVDLAQTPPTQTQLLSDFADGGGWTTQVVLVNPTASAQAGTVQFFSPGSGNTAGQLGSSSSYTVAPGASRTIVTSGSGSDIRSGSVRVVPNAGNTVPVPLVIFSYRTAGITVTESSVPATQGNAFRAYVESAGPLNRSGMYQSGIAIANPASSAATVALELYNLDGSSAGASTTVSVPPLGQVAKFFGELFPTLTDPLQGVLRISTTSPEGLSVVGLRGRYNERNDFLIATITPLVEGSSGATDLYFPHLADGGGFTTQFILLQGAPNQSASGTMDFSRQDSSPMGLLFP